MGKWVDNCSDQTDAKKCWTQINAENADVFVVINLMVEFLLQRGKGAERQRKETSLCFFAPLQ
jgi:hypothetical protein